MLFIDKNITTNLVQKEENIQLFLKDVILKIFLETATKKSLEKFDQPTA